MNIKKFLSGPGSLPLFRAGENPADIEEAIAEAGRLGWFTAVLDFSSASDKRSMMKQFAVQMKFPDYFGHNWDALEECLKDLQEWIKAPGYLLIIRGYDASEGKFPEEMKNICEILESVSAFWSSRKPPVTFKTVLA
ncbi:MAG: barstar family protein [bacterium]